ncbi:unnamed protein product [Sphenostylis stenocarpa]|uniref:Uncharacterized protein n=1 Tax=Sphenostylis stenocarpa TaxID=92480 RepID=A0AA86VQT6_9FABA|nr:unnamed protein product [Sphenostylis stenocarpa]
MVSDFTFSSFRIIYTRVCFALGQGRKSDLSVHTFAFNINASLSLPKDALKYNIEQIHVRELVKCSG